MKVVVGGKVGLFLPRTNPTSSLAIHGKDMRFSTRVIPQTIICIILGNSTILKIRGSTTISIMKLEISCWLPLIICSSQSAESRLLSLPFPFV